MALVVGRVFCMALVVGRPPGKFRCTDFFDLRLSKKGLAGPVSDVIPSCVGLLFIFCPCMRRSFLQVLSEDVAVPSLKQLARLPLNESWDASLRIVLPLRL